MSIDIDDEWLCGILSPLNYVMVGDIYIFIDVKCLLIGDDWYLFNYWWLVGFYLSDHSCDWLIVFIYSMIWFFPLTIDWWLVDCGDCYDWWLIIMIDCCDLLHPMIDWLVIIWMVGWLWSEGRSPLGVFGCGWLVDLVVISYDYYGWLVCIWLLFHWYICMMILCWYFPLIDDLISCEMVMIDWNVVDYCDIPVIVFIGDLCGCWFYMHCYLIDWWLWSDGKLPIDWWLTACYMWWM